jgi:hypothetical protein
MACPLNPAQGGLSSSPDAKVENKKRGTRKEMNFMASRG